jgi:hypothetical protein
MSIPELNKALNLIADYASMTEEEWNKFAEVAVA